MGSRQLLKASFKQQDECLYIPTVNALSSVLEQETTAKLVFNAKLLGLDSIIDIQRWLWEGLMLKHWPLCTSHTLFFLPSLEIVRAMTHVINQGMAMYWGTSRWSAMEIMVKLAFCF